MAAIHATRARALVGTPYRAQGRDPVFGLDCVGLVLSAFSLPIDMVRADYRLRGNYRAAAIQAILSRFRRVARKEVRPGDLLALLVADDQLHFVVLTNGSFVHADARLRRVVETPGWPEWELIGAYRLRVRK
jgi:murein DD-endopeptidase / murein LD-carboxypeptidase